jgi:uncharacterized protein YkwD
MAYLDLIEEDPNRNRRNGLIVFVICVILLGTLVKCTGQVYTAIDISKVLNRTDSVSKLELLTAKKFHAKLNEYRKQNGMPLVEWSDTLYLSAMNHNSWMALNKTGMTHIEHDMTYNFTGVFPSDRLDYVRNGKGYLVSENVTYTNVYGNTINEIAESAAISVFNGWKHSKGHNDNMLYKYHKYHAVAFSFQGLYCTSNFCGRLFVKN